MKNEIFRGVATALITPFKNDEIDYAALDGIIENQISAGIDAIVVGGTTGEAATLSDGERYGLYKFARDKTRGKIPLILGTGSPNTKRAIEYTRLARSVGADGALVVTPYYNKGTKEGLYRHFRAICEAADLPIILYNVPSRTGVNLDIETLERLGEIPSVVGIKEADGSAERFAALSELIDSLPLYSGVDALIYTVLSLGGAGVISVVSNLYPRETVEICKQFFAGRRDEALKIQHGLARIINSLFLDTNPAPIKYAMARAGYCTPEMRLPMWLPTERCQRKIDAAIEEYEGTRKSR
ncbi:MAG: 4-hydroxy-tetrahydrodipicolinate synthase [Clostridia bacterium]|nr:4-hydroxy-tetrahydrodipicolinate synthase [Clostridia bacterium]